MYKAQEQVKDFHLKAGAVVEQVPTMPTPEMAKLRLKLIEEELDELAQALGFKYDDEIGVYKCQRHIPIEDLAPVADAIGDLLYVVFGTAVSCGIDMEPIFNEIQRSNMSKFVDGFRREDGKWVKGKSYSPVNLKPLIEAQLQNANQDQTPDLFAGTASTGKSVSKKVSGQPTP